MSRQIIKKPQLLLDLAEHFQYIGQDSEQSAVRFLEEAEATFDLIARMPGIGPRWECSGERLQGIHYTSVSRRFRKYLIFYRPIDGAVEILAIIHGMRDLPGIVERSVR